MASCSCGTRDKPNSVSPPVGAWDYLVVACGSLFGTRLICSRCKALLVLMGLGACLLEVDFWDMPENLPSTSRPAREVMAEISRAAREVVLSG